MAKKKETGSLALFGNDTAKGFENMTQEDLALPFLTNLRTIITTGN
jgi:hypothetical protein